MKTTPQHNIDILPCMWIPIANNCTASSERDKVSVIAHTWLTMLLTYRIIPWTLWFRFVGINHEPAEIKGFI